MVEIARVRTEITGWPGAPGLSTVYFRKTGGGAWSAYDDLMTAQVAASWNESSDLFPSSVTFAVQEAIDVIEDTTGLIQETLQGTATDVQGTSTDVYLPTATALAVTYQTAGVVNGKHVRGRTFLSPLWAGDTEANGTPSEAARTLANTFATEWLGAGTSVHGVVWSRPKIVPLSDPPAYIRFGSNHDITGHTVADKFAVLRSRRD